MVCEHGGEPLRSNKQFQCYDWEGLLDSRKQKVVGRGLLYEDSSKDAKHVSHETSVREEEGYRTQQSGK